MHYLTRQPLAMDGRILKRPGTGIATYARALQAVQKIIAGQSLLINDATCGERVFADASLSRLRRWIRAWTTRTPLSLSTTDTGYYAHDIYRLAHVYFIQTGRILKLRTQAAPGIAHWSLPVPIELDGWINIYTIHDVIPLTHPALTPMNSQRHRKLLSALLHSADHFVTVSNHARQAIISAAGCEPDRITNCSIGIAPPSANEGKLPATLVQRGYFLFVGSDDPRKNVSRIIAAHQASGCTLPLVLIGPHSRHAQRSNLIHLPQQPAEQLQALIAHARALIFPSLAEGFGLPVVEAMALGTATMTSNIGALREVAGDAALLVDPEDASAIAKGFLRLEQDDPLVLELERRGRQRAQSFSIERFTDSLATLYASLLPRLTDK